MNMKVCKFGGTSVASAEQIKKVAKIVTSDPSRKVVVVSAPGKRFSEDEKVTDLLIHLAEQALKGENTDWELEKVVDRYRHIATDLDLTEEIVQVIEKDLRQRLDCDKKDDILYMDNL